MTTLQLAKNLLLCSLYCQYYIYTVTFSMHESVLVFCRLRKHSDIHSCPLVHTELGNCLTLLKRHQEAMEHYSQALM